MQEIIYIQAGQLANHVGTHFWNAQQNYFTYGEDAEEPIVDHNVSFREGINFKGEPTFSPRLLLFDRKSNFGAVSDLYGPEVDADEAVEPWEGSVVEYRQDPIPPSQFHVDLEAETDGNDVPSVAESNSVHKQQSRYWSDYGTVYYHPRSMQRLPDPPEWEDSDGDWGSGRDMFERHNEDTDIMEGSLRAFVEECDHLQGIQVTHDTASFGSFVNVLLTEIRDEFVKLPCLTFPLLSPSIPGSIDADDVRGIKLALNDALVVQGLCELASIAIPAQSPETWDTGAWRNDLTFRNDDLYRSSALLSTHIESATLPLRLKSSVNDMSSLTSVLNWRGNNRIAHLSGILPIHTDGSFERDIEKRIYDFTRLPTNDNARVDPRLTYARVDVSRGFSLQTIESYNKWGGRFQPLPHSVHAPIIDLPASYPAIIDSGSSTITAMSSIQTTSLSAAIFKAYGDLANECLTKHSDVVTRMGVEMDEIKELRENMWTWEDSHKDDDGGISSDDPGLGEDEEY